MRGKGTWRGRLVNIPGTGVVQEFGHADTYLPRSPHAACGVAVRPHASAATRARRRAGYAAKNVNTHPGDL